MKKSLLCINRNVTVPETEQVLNDLFLNILENRRFKKKIFKKPTSCKSLYSIFLQCKTRAVCSPGLNITLSVSSGTPPSTECSENWSKGTRHDCCTFWYQTRPYTVAPLHTLPQLICSFDLFVSHTFLKTESLIVIWTTKKRAFQTFFPLSPLTTLAPWHFLSYTFGVHKKIVPLLTQQELWHNPWQCAICRYLFLLFLFVIRRCWNRNLIFTKQFLTVWMSLYSERCKVSNKDKD